MHSSVKILVIATGAITCLSLHAAIEVTDKTRKQGMENAPALIKIAGVPCTVTDAFKMASGGSAGDIYEVACQEGLGYVIRSPQHNQPPPSYLCIDALEIAPGAPTLNKCMLPGNQADAQRTAIAALIGKTNLVCELDRWRGIGHTASKTVIEVLCKGGDDQVLLAAHPLVADSPVQATPCLGLQAGSSISCQLSNNATQLAAVDALFNKDSGHACDISDHRYMFTTTTGDNYFELMCRTGSGYMIQRKPDGKLGTTIECSAKYATELGGCKLTKPASP